MQTDQSNLPKSELTFEEVWNLLGQTRGEISGEILDYIQEKVEGYDPYVDIEHLDNFFGYMMVNFLIKEFGVNMNINPSVENAYTFTKIWRAVSYLYLGILMNEKKILINKQ